MTPWVGEQVQQEASNEDELLNSEESAQGWAEKAVPERGVTVSTIAMIWGWKNWLQMLASSDCSTWEAYCS